MKTLCLSFLPLAPLAALRAADAPKVTNSLRSFKSNLLDVTARHLNLLLADDGSINSLMALPQEPVSPHKL